MWSCWVRASLGWILEHTRALVDATNFVKTVEQHQHRKIACLEEIAYLNGWISKDELMEVYEVMKKNQYGQYSEGCHGRQVSGASVLIRKRVEPYIDKCRGE